MTNELRPGTALVTVTGREFAAVDAVDESLTDVFPYAGPMRVSITGEGICRASLLQVGGPVDEKPRQALPPAPPRTASSKLVLQNPVSGA
ncbi:MULTISPECIES: hypothetical protein [unclassified Streptomyces]|uniref:hypothetical protein n=1 Tax=unclassified Streptomyces TaxID=2593676 RepID=UPI003D8B2E2A